MNSSILNEVLRWSVEDRVRFVQRVSDSIAAESDPEPLSNEQIGILERRIAALREDPSRGIPWDEAITRLRERYG